MAVLRFSAVCLGASVFLAGCSYVDDTIWPSLTGEAPAGKAVERVKIQPSEAEMAAAAAAEVAAPATQSQVQVSRPTTAAALFGPTLSASRPTGTFVGKKVAEMYTDLQKLQDRVRRLTDLTLQLRADTVAASQRYHLVVAAINAKLQIGTTPGNPVMVQKWNEAQTHLEQITAILPRLNRLSNDSAAEAAMAGYMLDTVRATYNVSGAIDEDHDQLRILEDSVNRTVVVIDRVLNELSEDVSRQSIYVSNERSNLSTMALAVKSGELYGTSLANRAFAQTQVLASAQAQAPGPLAGDRPLVVIRFDRDDVPYQQALYNAVSRALERRPNVSFDLVAVSPRSGTPAQVALNSTAAKRHAEDVLRSLADMGLPPNRIKLSATSNEDAESNEVHIYVR
jgi:hypothetical protein